MKLKFLSPWLINKILREFKEVPSGSESKIITPLSNKTGKAHSTNNLTTTPLKSSDKEDHSRNLQILQFLNLPENPSLSPSSWVFTVTDGEYSIQASFTSESLNQLKQTFSLRYFSLFTFFFLVFGKE
ncbi:hypothetical protein HMI54_014102 [Coelomomyces lativittatus]|nr:hypothetical protein HMI54_014102 [Coelomomyces lativittatus]